MLHGIVVIDAYLVSSLGEAAVAVLGLSASIAGLLIGLIVAFSNATQIRIAQAFGSDDEVFLKSALLAGLTINVAVVLVGLAVLGLSAGAIIDGLAHDAWIATQARRYLTVFAVVILAEAIGQCLTGFFNGCGETRLPALSYVFAVRINIAASIILIHGLFGAPELGVVGAATASVITQSVSLVGVVLYILLIVPQHQLFVRMWRADTQMLLRVFRLGLPIGLTTLSEVGLFAASAVMMGWLGTIPLAAHGIAVQLASITFMVHLGLSNVATIRAGNAYGRRDRAHMARGGIAVIVMSVFFAALTTFVFVGFPEPLIDLFMQDSEPARLQILAIGTGLLIMAALFQLVDGAQAIALGLLRGVQDTKIPMWMAAFSYWGVGVPSSYLLGFTFGFEGIGVWAGLVLGLGVASVLLNARFWGVTLKKVGPTPPLPDPSALQKAV